MRLTRAVLLALPAALLATGLPSRAATPPIGRVSVGRPLFWPGKVRPANEQGVREYSLDVGPGAHMLRVAFDHPDFRVGYSMTLVDPAGTDVGTGSAWMSSEVRRANPAAGRWTVRVTAGGGDYTEFRLRAILDPAPKPKPAKPVALLPNLRLVPPYELTFSGSLGSLGGVAVFGIPSPGGCTPDDTVQQQSTSCLRFSLGPSNVGAGPMELQFPGEGAGLATPGQAVQVVHWSDGRTTERSAGEFLYHATHAHYHHTGFGSLELLRVTDARTGAMERVSTGPKQGFCTGDVALAEWTTGRNAEQFSANSGCVAQASGSGHNDPTGTSMGLSAGWTDIYSWEQDGNYVNWPGGDGLYVVRSTADALNRILESDETDNTSYTYIRVTGTAITVLERARGQSPFDRHKVIATDGYHPLA